LDHVGIVVTLFPALIVVAFWQILRRVGYPGALALFALVPVVNVILLYVFAFSEWPNTPRGTATYGD
jgi:hypothetical protein